MTTIVAVYDGPERISGFKNGETYELWVVGHQVVRTDTRERVTYNSLQSFFDDWIVTGAK